MTGSQVTQKGPVCDHTVGGLRPPPLPPGTEHELVCLRAGARGQWLTRGARALQDAGLGW